MRERTFFSSSNRVLISLCGTRMRRIIPSLNRSYSGEFFSIPTLQSTPVDCKKIFSTQCLAPQSRSGDNCTRRVAQRSATEVIGIAARPPCRRAPSPNSEIAGSIPAAPFKEPTRKPVVAYLHYPSLQNVTSQVNYHKVSG